MINKRIATFLLLLLLGVGMVAVGYADITDKIQVTSDQDVVEGEITAVEIQKNNFKSVKGPEITPGMNSYYPLIQYNYTYNGEEYTHKTAIPSEATIGENPEEHIKSEYSAGDKLSLYVDTENPSQHTFTKSTSIIPYVMIVIGGIIALLTLFLGNRARKA